MAALSLVNPGSEDIFWDIGSGTGKPMAIAGLLGIVKECLGVELLEQLASEGNRCL